MSPSGSGRRVAITIDDGPAGNRRTDLETFERVADGIRESLLSERVAATLFVNEQQLDVPGQRDRRVSMLERWVDAGLDVGNHTYSHKSANREPAWRFQDDVVKGEVITRPLMESRSRELRWFRWPFLQSGATADVHDELAAFLEQRGYRVVPATVDYKDYLFAEAYARERRRGTTEGVQRVERAYLDAVESGFHWSEGASRAVFDREIAQILLIHSSELNSVTLRASISRMRQRGYAFITLAEAMGDPALARPDTFADTAGGWFERAAITLGRPLGSPLQPLVPEWIHSRGASAPYR